MSAIAVIGSGAIGTVLAAAAARSGHEVVMCVRTPVDQLVLEVDGRPEVLPVTIRREPAEVAPVDWVLLATKAPDTVSAAPWLDRLRGEHTVLVVVQNGVEHEANAAPVTGGATVLPALIYVGAERVAPGHVRRHGGPGRLVVPSGGAGDELAELLAGSGLDVTREVDFHTAAWRKLLSNVAANPITALAVRRTDVLREAEVERLARALLTEAVEVGVACGARLSTDDVRRTIEFYRRLPDGTGTSMLYDRLAGQRTEHELINGVVVRLGREHSVPTPANQAVYALLGAIEGEKQS
ncbi:MAG TPA: 2-dehydropantoate 2-reductase [Pseudonocardiaceae bacterium]|jgi:2-dehydropantoate 2-reductase|nr:2-dehydropantoate 2-reductase [Pseudonocardiaceae bacterium]